MLHDDVLSGPQATHSLRNFRSHNFPNSRSLAPSISNPHNLSKLNPLHQLPIPPSHSTMLILIIPIPPRIHRIILALLELIILLPLMRNDSTIHRALVVLRNGANHDSISARARLAIERLAIAQNREFEIGCGGVLEVEVLVVVIGMGVFVSADGLALGLD